MNRKIFKWLIPIYIAWFFVHMILFVTVIFSSTATGGELNPITFIPLMISHMLVIFLGLAFFIWMLIDCVFRKFKKENEKIVWIIIIVFTGILGSIIYYYLHGKNPKK